MNDTLYSLATVAIPMIVAIVFHEVAHGRMARLLGDHTAQDMGRLSFNPLRHVDPVGTVFLPGMLALAHAPVFGWAKPVPVNIWQLRNPRYGMVGVAAAGPATNFTLALLAGLLAHIVEPWQASLGADGTALAYRAIGLFILANLVLGLFNLFPLPPLDGGRIAVGLLPRTPAMALARIEPFGLLLVMFGLFLLPQLIPGYDPMGWFFRGMVAPAFDFVLMLTGHG